MPNLQQFDSNILPCLSRRVTVVMVLLAQSARYNNARMLRSISWNLPSSVVFNHLARLKALAPGSTIVITNDKQNLDVMAAVSTS